MDNENQWFYIQGVIRSEDISSSNVVLSTSIADAMIELSGRGPVSDKQSPGWLARTLDGNGRFKRPRGAGRKEIPSGDALRSYEGESTEGVHLPEQEQRVKPTTKSLIIALGIVLVASQAWAVRLKDITAFKGIRSNPLMGYGLVVSGRTEQETGPTSSLRSARLPTCCNGWVSKSTAAGSSRLR